MSSRTLILVLVTAVNMALAGCAANPATGGADIVLMSENKEISIGQEMHDEMIKNGAAYADQEVQDYINRIGQNLAKNSDRPKLKYTFTVIDSEDINAFALPGGFIYINRGLMSYLDNEAELAAVLSHEIGHVTARHSVRQQTASAANSVLAQLAYITTGSADLADASNTAGTALVRGYGRDHELEADREGSQYLHRAGYDPYALLDVISVLKDQEQYQRVRAKAAGKPSQSYHGLFSTHPRNDKRLQEVIQAAAAMEQRPPAQIDQGEFRGIINGMTYGKGGAPAQREGGRYYHNKLSFSFAYPEGWTVKSGSRAIVSHATDRSSSVTITIKRSNTSISDRDFINQQLLAPKLLESSPLKTDELQGYWGVSPAANGGNSRRLALLHMGSIAYLFEGEVVNEADFNVEDAQFKALIESFRPMKNTEREGPKQRQLAYIQATPGITYAALAKQSKIPDAENQLRLLNGQYPRGEPRADDWIKVVL
ncbi:M48 family metalloprotease [Candidatus Litorirhabdus singularis]|nr:M48 family metalloprotease [Candidatus Litorirhabdus singularis]